MIFLIAIILDVLVGALAASRGRNGIGYFLIALLLSPVIGLIIVLCTRNLAKEDAEKARREDDERRHRETLAAIMSNNDKPDATF